MRKLRHGTCGREKHTAGPWSVAFLGSVKAFGGSICDTDGNQVALITVPRNGCPAERMANAELIAAAPELLAACKMALECHSAISPIHVTLRLAIAKAEQSECRVCAGTGFYGDNGPGIKGNTEHMPCNYCRKAEQPQ